MTFNRKIIKLNFQKIFRVENLNTNLCNNFINYAYDDFPYRARERDSEDPITEGFNNEFIIPFKEINRNIQDDHILENIVIDKINIGTAENLNSNVHLTTYARESQNDNYYVDIVLMPELNLITVIGPKIYTSNPINTLKSFLEENNINFNEVKISHDFILWLVYKLDIGESTLLDGFCAKSFNNMGSAKNLCEEISNIPMNINTKNECQTSLSFPIMYGIVNNHEINNFRGVFY